MQRKTSPQIGRYAPDFELPGTDGQVHHLARYLERFQAIAIVFLSNACPRSIQQLPGLIELQRELGDRGFTLIGINANDTVQLPCEALGPMGDFARTQGFSFPYLRDVTQDVARAFDASCTPEAFLLDVEGRVRYQGRIEAKAEVEGGDSAGDQADLRSAALALLQGTPLVVPTTIPEGQPIYWR
jgi:peroxiredoxin